MTDEGEMRLRLQHVAAYRELCRSVQRSGRENVAYALVMLALAYFLHTRWMGQPLFFLTFGVLIAGELLVGLFKWAWPSAEGFLLDAVVLLLFAAIMLGIEFLRFQNRGGGEPVMFFLGLYILFRAINRIKYYGQLRKLFAERPAAEHIAWFDELVYEINGADPHSDQLALDLPTRPHWKAKLLGSTVFFVANNGNAVWVIGPDEFTLKREKTERGTGFRRARLNIQGERFPEFEIDDVSWANYQKWMASQESPQTMA